MDLEGYARRGILRNDKALKAKLADRILEIKNISRKHAEEIANAVIVEANATMNPKGDILTSISSGVTMGEFGVGSRGGGDFYTHEKIAEVIGKTSAVVDSSHLDDSGVVRAKGTYLVVTIDGMHSRLSDFPFLVGFPICHIPAWDLCGAEVPCVAQLRPRPG